MKPSSILIATCFYSTLLARNILSKTQDISPTNRLFPVVFWYFLARLGGNIGHSANLLGDLYLEEAVPDTGVQFWNMLPILKADGLCWIPTRTIG